MKPSRSYRFLVARTVAGAALVAGGVLLVGSGVIIPASATAESPLPASIDAALRIHLASAPNPALEQAVHLAAAQGVDETLLRSLLETGTPDVLTPETLVSWIEHSGRLAAEGIPTDPVLSRYLQGLAKGIPPARIESAVAELEDRLRQAAVLVDAAAKGAPADPRARLITIDHTAYALGVGTSPRDLERSLGLAGQEARPVEAAQAPILALGLMVAAGVPRESSLEVVETAWEKGYRGESLERLGKSLGTAGPDGSAPSKDMVREVLALLSQEGSQDRFFEGLDEIMGRQGFRLPAIGIEDDGGTRGGRTRVKDPIETPKDPDNQRPVIGD